MSLGLLPVFDEQTLREKISLLLDVENQTDRSYYLELPQLKWTAYILLQTTSDQAILYRKHTKMTAKCIASENILMEVQTVKQ